MEIDKGLYCLGNGNRRTYFLVDYDSDNELRVYTNYTENPDVPILMNPRHFCLEKVLSKDEIQEHYSFIVDQMNNNKLEFRKAEKIISLIGRALHIIEKEQSLPKYTNIEIIPKVPGENKKYSVPDDPGPVLPVNSIEDK